MDTTLLLCCKVHCQLQMEFANLVVSLILSNFTNTSRKVADRAVYTAFI